MGSSPTVTELESQKLQGRRCLSERLRFMQRDLSSSFQVESANRFNDNSAAEENAIVDTRGQRSERADGLENAARTATAQCLAT